MSAPDLSSPRLPPQNLEAEQSVLGAILLDNEALNKVMDLVTQDDFYRTSHRRIFRAMLELDERNEAIDQVTLTEYLKGDGSLEGVGGSAYIAELVMGVPSSANARYHARIVRDKAVLRGLIHVSTDIITDAYDGAASVEALLDNAERTVFSLAQGRLGRSFTTLKEAVIKAVDLVDSFYSGQKTAIGVPTGYTDLDYKLSGFQPSDLVIIAGRPSMGKTSLALGMAIRAAIKHNKKIGVFSLEMSKEQLAMRMLSSEARIDSHAFRTGKLQKEDWRSLTQAAARLENAQIFIDDSGALSVQQMRGKARRLQKEQKGLDLLIVDYLQLMQGRSDSESRQQEISDISRSLKALAKELQIPVVALSQLSRAVESRKPAIPILADLRESGAIEQDADVVMFIYRDEVYNPENVEMKGIADIIVAKHRNGPTGKIQLHFHEQYASFENLADGESV